MQCGTTCGVVDGSGMVLRPSAVKQDSHPYVKTRKKPLSTYFQHDQAHRPGHLGGDLLSVAASVAVHRAVATQQRRRVPNRPWLLDRSTSGSPGTEHAALVEPGARLGDARRRPAGLPAGAFQAACWLRDRTFFVLGDGHCAVIDIDTGRYEWIVTPVGRPRVLVRLDERRVLVIGADRYVQSVVLDTVTHTEASPTAVNLAGPVRSATRIGDAVYVLARAPLDHATTVPVVARLDLGRIGASC